MKARKGDGVHPKPPTLVALMTPTGIGRGLFLWGAARPSLEESMSSDFERRIFDPETGAERIEALRVVLSSKEPAKIDGVFVEYHWARMILDLYEELAVEAQRRLADTPISRIPDLIDEWAKGSPKATNCS